MNGDPFIGPPAPPPVLGGQFDPRALGIGFGPVPLPEGSGPPFSPVPRQRGAGPTPLLVLGAALFFLAVLRG